MTEHVRVRPGDPDPGGPGEVAQAAGGRVPVHPGAAGVQQDRPARAGAGRPVDGPADRGRQRDQDDLGALARLLSMQCPPGSGFLVELAVTIQDGTGFVFTSQNPSGATAGQRTDRAALRKFLAGIRFQR
jgi:hypothetical protein